MVFGVTLMKIYNTVIETLYNDDFRQYTSYGMDVLSDENVLLHISDLSVDKNAVDNFCHLLNSYEVDPNDIWEYIEDFLATFD